MTTETSETTERDVLAFLSALLQRDGAATESLPGGRLDVVVEPPLTDALGIPEAARLSLFGEAGPSEVPFPLEGQGMQWAVDQARTRGRLAGARLPGAPRVSTGLVQEAKRLGRPLNAQLEGVEVLPGLVTVSLLEFAYEARSEERTEGRVFVAIPDAVGTPSFALAQSLLEVPTDAVPEPPALSMSKIEAAARQVLPPVRTVVRERMQTFLDGCARRLAIEQERLVAYFDNLALEAGRRRGRASADAETLESKRAAILRQREERLEDLADRHAVEIGVRFAGALTLRYEGVICRFHVRRRRAQVTFDVFCDALNGEVLGPPCRACGTSALTFHVCDEKVHLTCPVCAARCSACGRTTCRACRPSGCDCP